MPGLKFANFRGTETARKIIDSFKDEIIVYFDPDVDGMVAGYLVCRYLQSIGKKFTWYVNSNREHNWSLPMEKVKGKSVIAVDFLIPPSTVNNLIKANCSMVSMDHHVNIPTLIYSELGPTKCIVINNQYVDEPEEFRFLSGAGVVFNVLRKLNPAMDTEENRALVGLTLLSDVCEIENPIARGYLSILYNHKFNGYIKYLIQGVSGDVDYGFGVPRMDRNFVDYTFSPAINSNLRFNKEEDVVRFFLGLGKLDLTCHKRQQELVRKITEIVKVRDFPNLRVIFFKDWELDFNIDIGILSNFVGLVASKYLDGKRSVIAYVISKDSNDTPYVGRASFRGNINGVDYLTAVKGVVTGVGHPSAFGIKNLIPVRETFDKLNDLYGKVEEGVTVSKKITPVPNLSIFANRQGKFYADYNMYCLSQHRKYIRYIGKNIDIRKSTKNYIEYIIDGITVKCFDQSIDFTNGLILPTMERGYVYYYLQPEGS